jgi:hypothetical protein
MVWLNPLVPRYCSIFSSSRDDILSPPISTKIRVSATPPARSVRFRVAPFELVIKRLIIKENVWIVEMSVEPVLELLDGFDDALEVTVSSQDNKRGIRFSCGGRSSIFVYKRICRTWPLLVGRRRGLPFVFQAAQGGGLAVPVMRKGKDKM